MRTKYDSFIKLIYSIGLEKSILSDEIRSTIPRSTASTWRKMKPDQLLELKYSEEIRKNVTKFIESENQIEHRDRMLLYLGVRLRQIIIDAIGGKKQYQKLLSQNKYKLINTISNCSIFIDKTVLLRILGIKSVTYYRWKSDLQHFCTSSPIHLCAKDHPQQISLSEFDKMQSILKNPDKKHWSIASLHGEAFKNLELLVSRATIYKYNSIFKFRLKATKGKKPPYNPLRASRPNEIWHADISVFRTEDGKKYYIYAIIDNYSRKILNWDISNKLSGRMSKRLLHNALKHCKLDKLHYITDGGSENTNYTIKQFLNAHHASIAHSIALRDIRQSNSMIESVFRTMKSGFLYLHRIPTLRHLVRIMTDFVYEYNELRPHHSQSYYTPSEIYNGVTNTVDTNSLYEKAYKCRYSENKSCSCVVCHKSK